MENALQPTTAVQLQRQLDALPAKERKDFLRKYRRTDLPANPMDGGQMVVSSSTWSGPIPPPAVLEKMNEVIPGSAERILRMAEEQAAHRRSLETLAVSAQLKQGARGQLFALALGLAALISAVTLAYIGSHYVAGVVATIGLGTLAVAFITGKHKEQQSRTEKVS